MFLEQISVKVFKQIYMSVKQRLIQFLKYKGLSQSEFERECSISNGYVNNIRVSIGDKVLQKIALRFPELNIVWLKMEVGEMINKVENKTYLSMPIEIYEPPKDMESIYKIMFEQQKEISILEKEKFEWMQKYYEAEKEIDRLKNEYVRGNGAKTG